MNVFLVALSLVRGRLFCYNDIEKYKLNLFFGRVELCAL